VPDLEGGGQVGIRNRLKNERFRHL